MRLHYLFLPKACQNYNCNVDQTRLTLLSRPLAPKEGAAIGAAVHPVLCGVAAEGEERQHAAPEEAQQPG